jgi:circadian clock protein KaiC
MSRTKSKSNIVAAPPLQKVQTGIAGFDEITIGGLPKGRPSLICGDAGSGKTLFSMEFLIRGAMEFNEPGVFIAFEEKASELATNVTSLGFNVNKLIAENKIRIDYVHLDRSEIEETGEYDLGGLFIRLEHAVKSIGAKRVVLDTIENLFGGLTNKAILRSELRRLFQWLKDHDLTAVITAEKGDGKFTREGLEEYVSDCVILLDHRVESQISTRRLRIVKYRGSVHGTNEYPFLIDEDGISVLPVTSLRLEAKVSAERVSTGIPTLNAMLDGNGFYKGSSILISGTAGTGKTSIAASFAQECCLNNKRCIYFAFEESPAQIKRNMKSIGIDLEKCEKKGLLKFQSSRPNIYGLEMHLVVMTKIINNFKPDLIIVDPISNLVNVGSMSEVQSILTRLLDFLQGLQITTVFTGLVLGKSNQEQTDENISSLMDAWIQVRDIETNGERNRGLYIMKSRGMYHSNQVREFNITDNGLKLEDVFLGPDGVLIGSAKHSFKIKEQSDKLLRANEASRIEKDLELKKKEVEIKIQKLKSEFDTLKAQIVNNTEEEEHKETARESRQMEIQNYRVKNSAGQKRKKMP